MFATGAFKTEEDTAAASEAAAAATATATAEALGDLKVSVFSFSHPR
jgi:hypothetical protein